MASLRTCGGPDPGQAQDAVVKVPVGEDVGQAVVVVVLLRVQLQELLHADVGEAEGVQPVTLVAGGVDLQIRGGGTEASGTSPFTKDPFRKTTVQMVYSSYTHPDPLHHEADVANAHEVRALVDGIDGLHMAGDLRMKPWLSLGIQVSYCTTNKGCWNEFREWNMN